MFMNLNDFHKKFDFFSKEIFFFLNRWKCKKVLWFPTFSDKALKCMKKESHS